MRTLSLSVLLALAAAAQVPTPEGDALFAKGDWAGAARDFELAVSSHPDDGRAWFRLGSALHRLGKYEDSVRAFQAAAEHDFQAPYAAAAVARGYAAMNRPPDAVEWLRRAAQGGFAQLAFVDSEPAFASLKTLPAFSAARERIRINAKPCTTGAEYKQLDFWLGEWDVEVSGRRIAHSRIEKISDGCIVQENWMPFNGLNGKSWNFYNRDTTHWEQVWIGPDGRVTKYEGELKDGEMRFLGAEPQPGGAAAQARLTFSRLPDGTVHQLSERSLDGGKTWTTGFDGIYRRTDTIAERPISSEDRRELLAHLKTSRALFHEALQGVTPAQAAFRPGDGRWSILECAEHIAQAEQLLFADALNGLQLPTGDAKSKVSNESLLQAWGTATVKVKSSGEFDPTGRWPDLAAVEKAFDARRERSIDFVSETERNLHGRICCGDLDIWQQILAMSAHTLRHIHQIEEVKTAPGYPAADPR